MTGGTPGSSGAGAREIGIVMLSALGDAVHVLPVLNAIKRHEPASRISWILQPGPARLVHGHPAVDERIVFERRRGWRGFLELRAELARRPFDVVLALQSYLKTGIITAFARAPVKMGFDRGRARDLSWVFTNRRLPPRPRGHIQDEYLEFLDALRVPRPAPEAVEWRLGPWPQERGWQREFLARFDRPLASCVVATSKPEKDWEPDRWAETCDALAGGYGLQPVLLGGGSARELAAQQRVLHLCRHAVVPPIPMAGGTTERELVAILDGSSLVISPDTGPLHMAVALGRPAIGLYGYTNPARFGPYGRFRDLMIDAFGDAGESYTADAGHRKGRMQRITVADVLARVERWRQRYAETPADPAARRVSP